MAEVCSPSVALTTQQTADYMKAERLLDLACTAIANLVASKPARAVHGVFITAALATGKRKAGEAAPSAAASAVAWPPALPAEAMSSAWDDAQPYSTAAVKEGLSMAAQDCPDPSASSALRIARDWRALGPSFPSCRSSPSGSAASPGLRRDGPTLCRAEGCSLSLEPALRATPAPRRVLPQPLGSLLAGWSAWSCGGSPAEERR